MTHQMAKGTAGYWRGLAARRQHKADTHERRAQEAREEREVLLAIADRAEREGILIMPEDANAPGVFGTIPPAA